MEINSIKDLIDALEQLGEPEDGYTRFFRGHSNAEKYKLEPSIYREDNKYYHNEDNIIRDAIINNPDEFSDEDTLFDTLVKLQHYGYPTRLLDLTSNPLVAAYFTVCNFDNHGEIIIFDIPNNDIKYFDSDTVSILSAISLRKSDFSINIDKTFLKVQSLCAQADFLTAMFPGFNLTTISLGFKNAVEKNLDYQSSIPFSENRIKELEKEVKRVTNDETNIVFVNERSLEIFSKTCDKAVAANFLLRKDGLTLKDAVSFGDGVNDYDLITQTGLGFAMENSIYRLLEKLSDTEIIESNKSDGMAKKVREIFNL